MKGLLFVYLLAGCVWLQLFESAYRETVKPSLAEYLAFSVFTVTCWPYPLYLIFKKSQK